MMTWKMWKNTKWGILGGWEGDGDNEDNYVARYNVDK
jgi:hypothetical protein